MVGTRLRLFAGVVGLLLLIGVVGWGVGTWVGRTKLNREREVAAWSRAKGMADAVEDIKLGLGFPDVVLASPDGADSLVLREALPNGGAILYLSPSCTTCLTAAADFERWLADRGLDHANGVLVTDDPHHSIAFAEKVSAAGLSLRVYTDKRVVLRAKHGVMINPAIFVLDGDELLVTGQGTWDEGVGFAILE